MLQGFALPAHERHDDYTGNDTGNASERNSRGKRSSNNVDDKPTNVRNVQLHHAYSYFLQVTKDLKVNGIKDFSKIDNRKWNQLMLRQHIKTAYIFRG